MPMYKLIEYSDNYSKILGTLWQFERDELALDNKNVNIDFPANSNDNSNSFEFK